MIKNIDKKHRQVTVRSERVSCDLKLILKCSRKKVLNKSVDCVFLHQILIGQLFINQIEEEKSKEKIFVNMDREMSPGSYEVGTKYNKKFKFKFEPTFLVSNDKFTHRPGGNPIR